MSELPFDDQLFLDMSSTDDTSGPPPPALGESECLYGTLESRKKNNLSIHRFGGCWRRPEMYQPDMGMLPTISEDVVLHVCKQCWPEGSVIPIASSSAPMEQVAIPEDMSVASDDESSSTCSASTTDAEAGLELG